ncbi:MAG: luciferase family protein [Jatrophihabitans sp.]
MISRTGPRPTTSTHGPHRQLDQRATPELWGRLVHEAMALPGVTEGHSQVSPAPTRALLLLDLHVVGPTGSSLAAVLPVEPAHIHGVTDTSLHICLPAQLTAAAVDSGWAEPHQYADHPTEVMVYAPRDESELGIVVELVRSSIEFAMGASLD